MGTWIRLWIRPWIRLWWLRIRQIRILRIRSLLFLISNVTSIQNYAIILPNRVITNTQTTTPSLLIEKDIIKDKRERILIDIFIWKLRSQNNRAMQTCRFVQNTFLDSSPLTQM